MPYIDYTLTTEADLTKEQISTGFPRQLTPTLELGKDNRTWNKEQLKALKLILCNIIDRGNKDEGVFLYSRKAIKKPLPRYNPHNVSPRSLIVVIDKLQEAGILTGRKALPRIKGMKDLKLTSWFEVTEQSIDFAVSLGINRETVKSVNRWHVRLRDCVTDDLIPFEWDENTMHIERCMSEYCNLLNQCDIMLGADWDAEKGEHKTMIAYGDRFGEEHIHLYRNYRNHSEQKEHKEDFEKLFIDMKNPNFAFGGRSGSYWMSGKAGMKENRPHLLINGNKTKSADFPCMHINLCYRQETKRWLQTENKDELKEQGRIEEDGYYIEGLHRDIPKKMVQLMLNVKSRRAVSMVFNKWIKQKHKIPADNATDEQVEYYKESGLSPIQIMDKLEEKHKTIKDYFYKGKLAGQIIQNEEANVVMHLALYFTKQYETPCLTVYDELIVEEKHHAMVKEFMFTTTDDEIYKKYSLMNQIKYL